jgi:hypothetical protein
MRSYDLVALFSEQLARLIEKVQAARSLQKKWPELERPRRGDECIKLARLDHGSTNILFFEQLFRSYICELIERPVRNGDHPLRALLARIK